MSILGLSVSNTNPELKMKVNKTTHDNGKGRCTITFTGCNKSIDELYEIYLELQKVVNGEVEIEKASPQMQKIIENSKK